MENNEKRKRGGKEKARSVHLSVQIFEFVAGNKNRERKRTWLKFFKAIRSSNVRNASKRRSWTRDWSGIKIFPGEESLIGWAIRVQGGRALLVRGKKTCWGSFRDSLGVFFFLGVEWRRGEILSYNGVHVTPVQPDPTVRRYVARVYVNRGVGLVEVSRVPRPSRMPERDNPFFFCSTFQPSWRPVLAGTRFENSGLFKGNYRFYFRSARQFEFLIERKEVSSCGWVLGNCAIGTDTWIRF